MNLLEIQNPTCYVQRLNEDAAELDKLYERILIKTTAFFRDPEAFDSLKRNILEPLVRRRSRIAPIRVWVVGCSTGEEVYSLAICLTECLETARRAVPFQILSTDLSETALRKARAGEYSLRALEGVSPRRLSRFFTRSAGGYRIHPQIRGACVFSRHDLVASVPFSRMDLVTCRNVLIYMEPELQRRALSRLHFALKPGGILMLGATESLQKSQDYSPIDRKWRIYRRHCGPCGRRKTGQFGRTIPPPPGKVPRRACGVDLELMARHLLHSH
jgi:two-component system CheB/CheR fusion protein